MILAIFKLTFIIVAVAPSYLSLTVEDICDELPLVDRFVWWQLWVHLRIEPYKFSITLHARIYKFSDVVSAVGPLEFSLSFNARVPHGPSVYVDLGHSMYTCG